jgi:hypothetical protein
MAGLPLKPILRASALLKIQLIGILFQVGLMGLGGTLAEEYI